jgi:ABC-type sulfate/molybdate transport systems ATPase subunit
LRRLKETYHFSIILVTHDRDEAFQLADRMIVLLEGAIQQIGEPKEIYFFPENRKVAKAMGETNFISGTVNGHKFQMEDAEITVQNPASIHGDAVLFIPSGTEFTIKKIAGIPAFVEFSEWTPNGQRAQIRIGATSCMFTNVSEKLVAGEKIFLTFNETLQVMEC